MILRLLVGRLWLLAAFLLLFGLGSITNLHAQSKQEEDGREFARSVFGLSLAQWHGPILSGYGTHLVYVHHRREAPPVTFATVQDRVRQDWENDKRQELNDKFIANLLARYDVIIEDHAVDGGPAAVPERPQ